MLKIFSDKRFAPPDAPPTTMLAPFWGAPPEYPRDPVGGRFERYVRVGREFLELSPLENADIAVLPLAWEHAVGRPEAEQRARAFVDLAAEAGVPQLVFYVSDSADPVPLPASAVYRTSLYRSRQQPGEYAMPALCEDIVGRHRGGRIDVRPKRPQPSVGFCGLAPRPARFRRSREGSAIRRVACERLGRASGLTTSFIFRDRFWGGALVSERADFDLMAAVRTEYVENLLGSDYVLCARGGGNYSYRLYEALSAGRIPIFVDTDCVLPLADRIDWRALCVWVDQDEIDEIAERLTSFHESLAEGEFEDRQRECRQVWERYLSPEGFYRTLAESFSSSDSAAA